MANENRPNKNAVQNNVYPGFGAQTPDRESGSGTSLVNGEFIQSVFDRQKNEKRLAEENSKASTSAKLDLMNAMAIDPRLKPTDFRVAYWLVQHVNSVTGSCYPSQRLIAEYCNLKERTVRSCIRRLIETKWLRSQKSGKGSNRYQFIRTNVSAMLDRQTSIRDSLKLEKAQRHVDDGMKAFDRHQDDGHNRQGDDAKHLRRTPELVLAMKGEELDR